MPNASESIRLSMRDLWRVFALAFAAATLLTVMGASQSHGYFVLHGGTPPPWSQSLLWGAAQWYAWAVFVPLIVLAGSRWPLFGDGVTTAIRAVLHLGLAFAFACLHLLVQTTILWFVLPGGREFLGSFATGLLTLLTTTLQWELISYAAVLAATHVVLYLRRAQNEALARREMEARAASAQLSALKRQMQPHFLFNALNALVSMQREDSPEQRFTIRLAESLRLLLADGERASATLADELRLVDAYLHVERVRLGSRLRASVEVPESLRSAILPACFVQPLVENAVTHGVACDPDGGEIHVSAHHDYAHLRIEITNSCTTAATGTRGNGIALANCRRRLELMYGSAAKFDAGPIAPDRYRATIELPASGLPEAA